MLKLNWIHALNIWLHRVYKIIYYLQLMASCTVVWKIWKFKWISRFYFMTCVLFSLVTDTTSKPCTPLHSKKPVWRTGSRSWRDPLIFFSWRRTKGPSLPHQVCPHSLTWTDFINFKLEDPVVSLVILTVQTRPSQFPSPPCRITHRSRPRYPPMASQWPCRTTAPKPMAMWPSSTASSPTTRSSSAPALRLAPPLTPPSQRVSRMVPRRWVFRSTSFSNLLMFSL